MGSGLGLASGFGKLNVFGMDQPILAVCGDSTFYHAVLPALVNAIHNRASVMLVVLDNSGTAMTGFQPHPGLRVNAMGEEVPSVDIATVCAAMGAMVEIGDPFDQQATRQTINRLMEEEGVKVLILRQSCALSPEKKGKKRYEMRVEESRCLGEQCSCNRLCTRIFRCPGLVWDKEKKKSRIDEVICAGCGFCTTICPSGAILREEAIHQ
jgi:indolepyruvate ferredoxin oxidoreductase alpha subunit